MSSSIKFHFVFHLTASDVSFAFQIIFSRIIFHFFLRSSLGATTFGPMTFSITALNNDKVTTLSVVYYCYAVVVMLNVIILSVVAPYLKLLTAPLYFSFSLFTFLFLPSPFFYSLLFLPSTFVFLPCTSFSLLLLSLSLSFSIHNSLSLFFVLFLSPLYSFLLSLLSPLFSCFSFISFLFYLFPLISLNYYIY